MKTSTLTCSISGDVTITSGLSCTSTGQLITVRLPSQITAGQTLQLNINDGFTTPSSSAETSTFGLSTFLADGATMVDFRSTGVVMSVSPNSLKSGSIVQSGSGIVAQTTRINVQVQLRNAVPQNGVIYLTFPKWNPLASSSQLQAMIANPTSVSCTAISNLDTSLQCAFDSTLDTLTISNAFASGGRAADTVIAFTVSSVRNPLSFQAISVSVSTATSNGVGIIDESVVSYAPTSPASITSSTTLATADDTTVQEHSNFRMEFVSPVPLNTGTIVTVVFPQQFTFDSQKLKVVQGFGLFGSIRNLRFTLDDSQRSVKIMDGVESYKQAGITAKLVFQTIKNPQYVRKTDTFSVYLTDSSGFQIAEVTANVFFTPTAGTVDNTLVTVDKSEVNTQTSLYVSFQPRHSLTTNSIITMQIPTNLIISCTNFRPYQGLSSTAKCTQASATNLVFTQVFSAAYTSRNLTMQFVLYTNPASAQPMTGIKLQTYENVNDGINGIQNYTVDLLDSPTASLYTVSPALFTSNSIQTSVSLTYTPALFTFTLILANPVPAGGTLRVTLPSEVTPTSSTQQCKGLTSNLASSITCTLSTTSSEHTITLSNPFPSALTAQSSLSFTIANLKTPPSTRTSSSFRVQTTDAQGYVIDQVTTLLSVTMLAGLNINSISASAESNTVSEYTTMTLAFNTPLPFKQGNTLFVAFPDELTAPAKGNLQCLGSDSLNTNQPCEVTGQIVTVYLSPRLSPTPEGSRVTLRLRFARNPLSTKATSEFKLTMKESEGFAMAQSASTTGASIIVGTPYPITQASITALDPRQMALTTITISLITKNTIPAGGYLQLNFDFIFFKFTDRSKVGCSTNLVQNVTCEFETSDTILMRNIFSQDLIAGSNITLTINNCLLEVYKKMETNSWVVTTMTPEGHMIDRVSKILTMTFPCNMPCQSCLSTNPNFCLSCNSISGNTILYRNKCYSQCPPGLYLDDAQQCQPCDSRCRSCRQDNPNYCLSCDINSKYPFLDGTTCIDSCPFGTFQNVRTAKCESCQSPCQTCTNSATQCTSCDEKGLTPFFHSPSASCYSQCPIGYLSPLGTTDNVCQACDASCKGCAVSSTQCTQCYDPLLLSQYDSTCSSTCPFGRTVLNTQTQICEICDQKCASCQGSTGFCTSCADNLFLLEKTGVCVGTCSTDNKLVGVNGVCTSCSPNCETCINKPDSCLTCTKGKYFFDFTCVLTCPAGYEVDEESNQCVIDGLRCPFGYRVNSGGNGCLLKAQICENGFKLNQAQDRCIPAPGNYIPFPFIYACIFLGLITLGSWLKFKETQFVTNLIAGISFVETIAIFVLAITSYEMGVYSTFGLSLLALLFLYGSNLFFCLVFLKQVSGSDTGFKHWSDYYPQTLRIVLCLGGFVNFKLFRVIYGQLFERPHFKAAFEDKATFYKPFTLISVFSLVTTMLPVIVAAIAGLVFIEYGYQVQMTCIELLIIELVLLGLMIYEKFKLKPTILKAPNLYYKMDPKNMDESNVMSGLQDGPGDPQDHSYYSLKTLIPDAQKAKTKVQFQDYYDRRRGLEQLISTLISKDATTKSEKAKAQSTEGQIAKLQEEELLRSQLRNCRSFRELRVIDEDFGDALSDDDLLHQNFISEPNSPREKAMVHNPRFVGSVVEFKSALRSRANQYDNVYAEARPAHWFPMRTCKLISVKVQTNILELLAIDDLPVARNRVGGAAAEAEEYVEENLTADYTQGILSKLVDHFKDTDFKKQRRRLPKNRLKELPNFELGDILGDFEVDETGAYVIILGKDGKLNDREGRRVNKRGYLVDQDGNVISQRGTAKVPLVIFKKDEIDSDDEIPAPFCFEKKKEALFKVEGLAANQQRRKKRGVEDNENDIEKEFQKIRDKNAPSNRSSVESLMGDNPRKYNQKNKRFIPGDEDGFLSKIVQPMQAKSKLELLNRTRPRNQDLEQINTQDTIKQGNSSHSPNRFQSQTRGYDSSLPLDNGGESTFRNTSNGREGFYSALAANQGVYRGNRPQIQPTSGSLQTDTFDPADFSLDRIQKLTQLKEVLGQGSEDKALLRQLENYERILKAPVQEAKPKANLAKKNLAKVYGKVQDKLMGGDFHQARGPPPRRLVNQSFLEDQQFNTQQDSTRRRKQTSIMTTTAHPTEGNSRLKNLENIYLKQQQRPQTNQSRRKPVNLNKQSIAWEESPANVQQQQQQLYRHLQHSMADTTGIESSDQDELRLRREFEQMKAILDKDQKMQSQITSKSAMKKVTTKNARQLLDGGWI